MRYITARKNHRCIFCKEFIEEGEICIQSQGGGYYIYHEKCHHERFGNSLVHKPTNKRPDENSGDSKKLNFRRKKWN